MEIFAIFIFAYSDLSIEPMAFTIINNKPGVGTPFTVIKDNITYELSLFHRTEKIILIS